MIFKNHEGECENIKKNIPTRSQQKKKDGRKGEGSEGEKREIRE